MSFDFCTLVEFDEWWQVPTADFVDVWEDGEYLGSGDFGDVRMFAINFVDDGLPEQRFAVKKICDAHNFDWDVGKINGNLEPRKGFEKVLPTLTVTDGTDELTYVPVFREICDAAGDVVGLFCFMGVWDAMSACPVVSTLGFGDHASLVDVHNVCASLLKVPVYCFKRGVAVPDFKFENIGFKRDDATGLYDVRLLDLDGLIFVKTCYDDSDVVRPERSLVSLNFNELPKFAYGKATKGKMRDNPANQLYYLTFALFYLAALSIANNVDLWQLTVFDSIRVGSRLRGLKVHLLHAEICAQSAKAGAGWDVAVPVEKELLDLFAKYDALYVKRYLAVVDATVDVISAFGVAQEAKYLTTDLSLLCAFTDNALI